MRSLLMNPVLNKEIKLRFRSFKSFLGVFFYLFVLGGIALGFMIMTNFNSATNIFRPEQSREMFMILSFVQMGLILFMTPGLTSGVISGERERQTLNILLTTPQSSTNIIISKLFSSIAYLLLIIMSSLPLYSIVFLFGGVSPSLLVTTFSLYLITMLTIGSIGILFSTLIRKTIIATIITYGVAIFLAAGTAFLMVLAMELSRGMGINQMTTSIWTYIAAMLNPFIVLMTSFEDAYSNEISRQSGIDISLIVSYIISYLAISFFALFIAINKLRPKMKPKGTR